MENNTNVLLDILNACLVNASGIDPVHGGDISSSYFIHEGDRKFFLKINSADDYPLMFKLEKAGLDLLGLKSKLKVPRPLKEGVIKTHQYLLLEWLNKGVFTEQKWYELGKDIADLHKNTNEFFGLEYDNYIGSLNQINKPYLNWSDFFINCRIVPLAERLFNTGKFDKHDLINLGFFEREIKSHFPKEPPALVHGDLWIGNIMPINNKKSAIYDPSVYYGHREMDIAMTMLFGGFDLKFYKGYNDNFPLEKNWEERMVLYQLYPLLVHAVLFGGNYINSARNTLKMFV